VVKIQLPIEKILVKAVIAPLSLSEHRDSALAKELNSRNLSKEKLHTQTQLIQDYASSDLCTHPINEQLKCIDLNG
jgi:hypothetical protein